MGVFAAFNVTESVKAKPYTKIPDSEIKSIVGMTNYARSHVKVPAAKMHQVHWNEELHSVLDQAVEQIDPSWWFSTNQTKARYNGQVLMDYEPFKSQFPGWDFLIHDGCQSSAVGLRRIFQYRALSQRPYFNYENCNETGFTPNKGYINSYMSCNAHDYPTVSNMPYSWVWQYMPKLLLENTTEIACMLTGRPGPNADGKAHPNHFFCYRNNATPQINEQPYKATAKGEQAGAECPRKVKNRLCV